MNDKRRWPLDRWLYRRGITLRSGWPAQASGRGSMPRMPTLKVTPLPARCG